MFSGQHKMPVGVAQQAEVAPPGGPQPPQVLTALHHITQEPVAGHTNKVMQRRLEVHLLLLLLLLPLGGPAEQPPPLPFADGGAVIEEQHAVMLALPAAPGLLARSCCQCWGCCCHPGQEAPGLLQWVNGTAVAARGEGSPAGPHPEECSPQEQCVVWPSRHLECVKPAEPWYSHQLLSDQEQQLTLSLFGEILQCSSCCCCRHVPSQVRAA